MLTSYYTDEQGFLQSASLETVLFPQDSGRRSWISLVNPTADEINKVTSATGIDERTLRQALDPYKIGGVDIVDGVDDGGYIAIVIDVPFEEDMTRGGHTTQLYQTYPLGLIMFNRGIVTVSLKELSSVVELVEDRARLASVINQRSMLVLAMLHATAQGCTRILADMNHRAKQLEERLYTSLDNEQLIKLLVISKSLIFLNASLSSNKTVVHTLAATNAMMKYDAEGVLIHEVVRETDQALEMITIYSAVLKESVEVSASIIANNQNKVMKFLAAVTLVVAVPTVVSGLFGMNVAGIPLRDNVGAFWIIVGACGMGGLIVAIIMRNRKLM